MLTCRFFQQQVDFSGKTLIIPSLYTQAPTIALDYIISSNKFNRVGALSPPFTYMEPSIGYLPKSINGKQNQLGLPMQLYTLGDVLILQLRSSIRHGRRKQFTNELLRLIREWKILEVLVVGVKGTGSKPDLEIHTQELGKQKNIFYLNSNIKNNTNHSICTLCSPQVSNTIPFSFLKDPQEQLKQVLQGTGLINNFYTQHDKLKQLYSLTLIFVFGNEIESKLTGLILAKSLRKMIGCVKKELGEHIIENL